MPTRHEWWGWGLRNSVTFPWYLMFFGLYRRIRAVVLTGVSIVKFSYLLSSESWPRPRCSQQMPGKPSPALMSPLWKPSSTSLSSTPTGLWLCPMPWTTARSFLFSVQCNMLHAFMLNIMCRALNVPSLNFIFFSEKDSDKLALWIPLILISILTVLQFQT